MGAFGVTGSPENRGQCSCRMGHQGEGNVDVRSIPLPQHLGQRVDSGADIGVVFGEVGDEAGGLPGAKAPAELS